jgi:signal transduction histidine kinase
MGTARRSLLRSSPVRQALAIVMLTAVISICTTGLAYLTVRAGSEEALQNSLDQMTASFSTAATSQALRTQVNAEAAVTDPEMRIVVFVPPEGKPEGNAIAHLGGPSPLIEALPGGRELSDRGYVLRVIGDARGTLVLGESREPVDEMGEVFAGLVAISLGPTVILSLALSMLLASRSARRVARIEDTLARLTHGDLCARVGEGAGADDLSRIGRRLDQMATAQEHSVAALKQVSADIAHDLKTPVQRIAVLLASLRDRAVEGSPEAEIAERAAAEADRAVSVFRSLLQIAQIEGGSPRSRFVQVDLSAILATFAEIYGPSAEDSGHSLHIEVPAVGAATVLGDKGLLGQVVANLIENALRHTPTESGVVLRLAQAGGSAVLTVADDGPGVPVDERARVLRRLYRLERSRTTPGNGLGLALVAAVAELHGATLELADNAPGLVVRLVFPVPVPPET